MRTTPRRWPILRQTILRFELMDAMMQAIGIEEASAARLDQGRAIKRAREQCLGCRFSCRCALFLDELDMSPDPPKFCLNIHFFQRCAKAEIADNAPPQG